MTRGMKNRPASVRARLTQLARHHEREVDGVFLQYMQERLLFRVGQSRYSRDLVLKGGVLLFARDKLAARPTRDIDFLARHLSNDKTRIAEAFREIASIACDDGVAFYPDSVTVTGITDLATYPGVTVRLDCSLEQARKTLRIDVGFGDVVVPRPVEMDFPTLLDNEPPRIWAYSVESVIAEKFEAMLRLSEANSRMKDFYDIYLLSMRFRFDGRILYEAIRETLERRKARVTREPAVLSPRFGEDLEKRQQWSAFLRRIARAGDGPDLGEVMERIRTFLQPVFKAVCAEEEFFGLWASATGRWERYDGEETSAVT